MKLPVFGLLTAAIAFAFDQLTKWYVTGPLALNSEGLPAREILPIFKVQYVENHGISLSLLRADSGIANWLLNHFSQCLPADTAIGFACRESVVRWALVAMTGAIAASILVWMAREPKRGDQIALGLVLGGALGNIFDRARLGYVVDFANLHFGDWSPFLVFNLGDAAITVGV
ncbi:MAG: signal peptidase II, partial [Sphingomonas sp.]|nr:signal peptidase II [Sphingomonas sp.]